MTRNEILKEIKKYFDIEELVCDHIVAKWGEAAWQFLDTDLLHCLLVVRRDIVQKPIYVNSKSAHQKGMRCNRCDLVKSKNTVYLSSHILGKAVDMTVPAIPDAEKVRELIRKNANLLPCNIRLEKDVSWIHMDVLPQSGVNAKIYEFNG